MGNHLSKNHNHTCPTHSLDENAANPLFGNTSFFQFNRILSGSCAAFVSLVIIGLMLMHATHFSKPNEQTKIMKIACLIPFYSIFSILSICFPKASVSLSPWLDVVQAFALGSFFLLMCEFVSESPTERDLFFAALEVPNKKGSSSSGGSLLWYRRRWIMIFQYPVVATLGSILTDITQAAGIYCDYVSKPYFARLWINLAMKASLIIAVISVLKFYLALKTHLGAHKPLAKLLAFKLVVIFTFILSIIFWILTDAKLLNPTSTLTYADLNIGIPNMIICILMVPLSVFFHYAYSCRPYFISNLFSSDTNTDPQSHIHYQGGFLGGKAWLRTINPAETLRAIVFAFSMAAQDHQNGQAQRNVTTSTQSAPPQYGPLQNGYVNQEEDYDLVGYQRGGRRQNRRSGRRH